MFHISMTITCPAVVFLKVFIFCFYLFRFCAIKIKHHMYYPSIRCEDMTNLQPKFFFAHCAPSSLLWVSQVDIVFQIFFQLYSLAVFGALCALGAAGAAGAAGVWHQDLHEAGLRCMV